MWIAVLCLLLAYLIGGFPSAVLVARLRGQDIFTIGSGNMGAMNTARHLGWLLGITVLLLDTLKGFLAVRLGLTFGGTEGMMLAGLGVVLGHAWSPYVRFRGGKALATCFGACLGIHWLLGVLVFVIVAGLSALLKRTDIPAFIVSVAYPPLVGWLVGGWFSVGIAVLMAAVVSYKHIPPRKTSREASRKASHL